VISFAEVQQILSGRVKNATTAPHENFWELPYEEFIAFEFPFEWGGEGKIRLITPGDGAGSNLIRGLKDGKSVVVTYADGRTEIKDVRRMPPRGGKYLSDEDLQKLVKWIDAGMPREGRP
jgi:hypothetical protein